MRALKNVVSFSMGKECGEHYHPDFVIILADILDTFAERTGRKR